MLLKNRSITSLNSSIDKLGFFSAILHIYYSVVWSVSFYTGPISLVKSFWIVAVVLLTIVSIPSYIIDDQAISKMSETS